MEPTGFRDVFRCVRLSIAAMEDNGLLPKPTNDPPVHRTTIGLHHLPPDHLQPTDTSGKSDMQKDGACRKDSHSGLTAELLMIPGCPSQNTAPLGPDSTPNTATTNGNSSLNKIVTCRRKPRTRAADPSKWKQNKQKQLRMEGKAYVSKRKLDGVIVTKQPRTVGLRCTSSVCKKALNRLCHEIDEDVRKNVFDEFWQRMNWAQRKLYVTRQVDRDPVERSRVAGSQSRRSVSLRYHLLVDGKRKQVCKNMFLSTLGIGEWSVLSWTQTGASNKTGRKFEKFQPLPEVPQLKPTSAADSHTKEVSPEQVSVPDRGINSSPELETRKKSRVAKPLTWKQNRQKQLRMEGKPYISKRKKDGATVTKAQRTIGPRCTSTACRKASNRFCADFSEEARNQLFVSFWQCMNWSQRKTYVSGLVSCDPVERTRAPWAKSRRSVSMRYHLIADGGRRQVCKKMFLSTLGIGEWSVLSWAQSSPEQDVSEGDAKKQTQRKSRKASEHIFLKKFLDSLPKVSSYSSKLYLEPVFSNMSEVYRHYYNHCMEEKTTPLSRQVFCAVFKKMDLGLCDPKKDQGYTLGASGILFNELWEDYCMGRGAPGPQLEK